MRSLHAKLPILLLGSCLGISCGGASSDGGVLGTGAGSSTLQASFVPDDPSPQDASVAMGEDSAEADTVVVDVNVTGTQGLFSASLDVTFDPDLIEYLGSSPGALFETLSGQTPIYLTFAQADAIVVGVTSTGGAVDVGGTSTLIRLSFRVLQSGSFGLAFDNAALNDDQVQPIPGISWSGGTLSAQ